MQVIQEISMFLPKEVEQKHTVPAAGMGFVEFGPMVIGSDLRKSPESYRFFT